MHCASSRVNWRFYQNAFRLDLNAVGLSDFIVRRDSSSRLRSKSWQLHQILPRFWFWIYYIQPSIIISLEERQNLQIEYTYPQSLHVSFKNTCVIENGRIAWFSGRTEWGSVVANKLKRGLIINGAILAAGEKAWDGRFGWRRRAVQYFALFY